MVWSLPAIVLLGLTRFATCTAPSQSLDSYTEKENFSENNVDLPDLLSTLNKRNGISSIDNGLFSLLPQNYPYRPIGGAPNYVKTAEKTSSQNTNFPGIARESPGWLSSLFLYGDSKPLSGNEGNDDSVRQISKSSSNGKADKPTSWKRRLQMQGPGLVGSTSRNKGLLGFNGNRNKGMVLSIDLGIKALRDAIYHAKVRQQNRKLQAQAQRNLKLLHNIGKRRAILEEKF